MRANQYKWISAIAAVVALLAAGCTSKVEGYQIRAAAGGGIELADSERSIWTLRTVEFSTFEPEVKMQFGFFRHTAVDRVDHLLTIAKSEDSCSLNEGGSCAKDLIYEGSRVGTLTWRRTAANVVDVVVAVDPAHNSVRLSTLCSKEDPYWGFGEQYNYQDLRGQVVPIWTQEAGVGRLPDSTLAPIGSYVHSYFPMPYYANPVAAVGVLLRNSEYSEFDVCRSSPEKLGIDVWSSQDITITILDGKGEIAALPKLLHGQQGGPDQAPPDWAFEGVWLAAQGGSEAVRARVDRAHELGIALSAVWVQDWVGLRAFTADSFGVKYRWTHDEELYPNLASDVAQYGREGVRFLGYFNPFVVPDYEMYATAAANGWLVKDPAGNPYEFNIITFPGGLVDVFNPAAAEWFEHYASLAVDLGMRGWMSDFGEWLPYDAQTSAGSGAILHNLYPTRWHQLSRNVLDAAYPDGDYVLLTRSGFVGESRVAQIVWAGDQEADFEEGDGIATVVRAGLSLGFSGVPFFTHDIAGFSGGPSTEELFLRWVELGAFTPIMRTHDGLRKLENINFDSNETTRAHFAKFSRIHKALLPYWKRLAQESVATGSPMLRHPYLVDSDPRALTVDLQWMVGPDLAFAPVVTDGTRTIKIWLPTGQWQHLPTGKIYDGSSEISIDAALGRPAIFARVGSAMLDADIVTEIKQLLK